MKLNPKVLRTKDPDGEVKLSSESPVSKLNPTLSIPGIKNSVPKPPMNSVPFFEFAETVPAPIK